MATKESKRVMELRKKNYDQLSILVPKGYKKLLQAMSIKERCNVSEVVRQAILERAGLKYLPDADGLKQLTKAETPREAARALKYCQDKEFLDNFSETVDEVVDKLSKNDTTCSF